MNYYNALTLLTQCQCYDIYKFYFIVFFYILKIFLEQIITKIHSSSNTHTTNHMDTGPVSYTHLDVYKRQVLYQENEMGGPKMIAFACRTLTQAEFNYTIT